MAANPIIVTSGNSNAVSKLITALIVSVAGGLAVWQLKKFLSNSESKQINEPEVQLASRIRTAVNPSGVSWLINTDTTDEYSLYQIAKEINEQKNFDKVAKSYQRQFSETLESRLRTEFDPNEYNKFFSIINTGTELIDQPSEGKSADNKAADGSWDSLKKEDTDVRQAKAIRGFILLKDVASLYVQAKLMYKNKNASKVYQAYSALYKSQITKDIAGIANFDFKKYNNALLTGK